MPKLQLEQWQSFEIFSRIICKVEGGMDIQIEDFFDPVFFNKMLYKYDSKQLCSSISLQIFGMKTDGKGNNVPEYPAGFYEFGRKMRLNEPVILDEVVLDFMLDFINSGVARGNSEILKVEKRKHITHWLPNKKQLKFQSSNWWLYFYDRRYLENDSGNEFVDGVARAVLTFHPFGKAEIKSFSPDRNAAEVYVGQYEMYGKEEKHLLLQMNLAHTNEKDLHILFYIGTGEISLSLGQYHNIGRSIYSGTVVIEREEGKIENFTNDFFAKVDSESKEIPRYIWDYFKDDMSNVIRTPCSITSQSEFKRWLLSTKL